METKHTVSVDFSVNSKELKQAMADVSKAAKTTSTQTGNFAKKDLGTQKQVKKMQDAASKASKQNAPRETAQMKQKTAEINKQNKALKEQYSWMQKLAQATRNAARGVGDRFARGLGPPGGPPPKGPKGGGGGGRGPRGGIGGRRGRRGLLGTAGDMLAGGLAAGAGALISMPFAAVANDYQAYISYQRSLGQLSGLQKGGAFGAGLTSENLNSMTTKMAGFGFSPEETASGARQFARGTGSGENFGFGGAAAKATGLDVNEVLSFMTEQRKGGGSFGEKGMHELQKVLQAAVKSGVNASTLPEFMEGVQSQLTKAGGAAGGAVSALPYAQLMALFNKSGQAGLQGARGANVMNSIDEGIKHPGGEEGQAFMLAALGFGRVGSNVDYYTAKKQQEQGLRGMGPGGVRNLFNLSDRTNGSEQESNMYLEGALGNRLTLDQIETVRGAVNGGKSDTEINKMLTDMTASELDVLKRIASDLETMPGFLSASKLTANLQKESIDRGAVNASAIQSMQETMNQFLHETMPAVADTMTLVADVLKELRPEIHALGELIKDPLRLSGSTTASDALIGTTDRVTARARTNAASGAQLSPEELTAAMGDSTEILRRVRQQYGMSPEDFASGLAPTSMTGMVYNADTGQTVHDDRTETRRQVFEQQGLLDALHTLNDQLTALVNQRLTPEQIQAAGIVGRVDTRAETTAALTALGINIPAGARARADNTGGVQ